MDNQIFIKRVWMPDGDIVSANLVYRDRPVLILDTGEEIVDDNNEITYEMTHEYIVDEKGKTVQVSLSKPVRVYLTHRYSAIRKYSIKVREDDLDIYPPSTNGFYGRLVRGKDEARYMIQDVVNENYIWLSVIESQSGNFRESHKIQPYEFDVIRLKTYNEHFDDLVIAFSSSNPNQRRKEILSVVDDLDLEWNEIYILSGGKVPSSLVRNRRARDILNQLVEINKYPERARDEILAFLVWFGKDMLPKVGIIQFLDSIYALPVFRSLCLDHLSIVLDGSQVPNYIEIVNEVAEGKAEEIKALLEDKERWSSDYLLRRRIEALAPDWQAEMIGILKMLAKSNKIATTYPISKSTAKNQSAIRSRIAMYASGLRLRAQVRPRALGLRELVYVGAAHRWPHWHLAFSIRLGPLDLRTPYFQSMVMPPDSAEIVKRVLPNVIDIEWSSWVHNANLYSSSKKNWSVRKNIIHDSLTGTRNFTSLQKEFGYWNGTTIYPISMTEAKLLDMATSMFYLSDLESKSGREYWQTDGVKSESTLKKLVDSGVIGLTYTYDRTLTLTRIFISCHGSANQIYSLTRALLKSVPTCLVMVGEEGNNMFCMARVPTHETPFFENNLPLAAENVGLQLNFMLPSAQRNYKVDLYQRLLNPDGTWNNDVTGFLSQIRSAPKDLAGHNYEQKGETGIYPVD